MEMEELRVTGSWLYTTCGKQERIDPTDRLEILHWSTFRPFVGLFSSSVSIRVAVPSPL